MTAHRPTRRAFARSLVGLAAGASVARFAMERRARAGGGAEGSAMSDARIFVRLLTTTPVPGDETVPADPWIVAAANAQGFAAVRALTFWIEMAAAAQTLYTSEHGGRRVKARRIESGVEVTGEKIGLVPQLFDMAPERDNRRLFRIGARPEDGLMLLAIEIR